MLNQTTQLPVLMTPEEVVLVMIAITEENPKSSLTKSARKDISGVAMRLMEIYREYQNRPQEEEAAE